MPENTQETNSLEQAIAKYPGGGPLASHWTYTIFGGKKLFRLELTYLREVSPGGLPPHL